MVYRARKSKSNTDKTPKSEIVLNVVEQRMWCMSDCCVMCIKRRHELHAGKWEQTARAQPSRSPKTPGDEAKVDVEDMLTLR